ncbi:hypothetical protein LCGC14_1252200 [marine sediment metagenome]|uniref:Uncharacterized protein n=1 Tax=marine sediment metagenome TaxID=412755 RepID=A0A0F9P6M8_9ZZZZ
MNEVRCPGRDYCPDKGCIHAEPHTIGKGCTEPCEGYRGQAQGSTCEPYSDLTYPLPPPRGPKSYVCNEASECGIAECTAAEAHTHNEPPLHGPRECGFTHQVVSCKEVPAQVRCDTWRECGDSDCRWGVPHAKVMMPQLGFMCSTAGHRVYCNPVPVPEPLRGVWVSGKALEVLTQYRDWSNDKWDAFWAMVTGKTARHTDAKRVMAEANGPEVPETITSASYKESVRAIIVEEAHAYAGHPGWIVSVSEAATARIMELPRPETP